MSELKGICNYCGQVVIIPIGEYKSEEEKNEIATMKCTCDEARIERTVHSAHAKIDEIFSTECKDIGLKALSSEQIEIIKESASAVCYDLALSVTYCFRNGIKAVIKGNNKGELEVQRTDTTNMKKLADDK